MEHVPNKRIGPCLAVSLIALMIVSGWSSGLLPFPAVVHAQSNANVAVNPPSIASVSYTPGSIVTVQVNATNSPPYAGFEVGLFYNISILQFSGLDYSANVFGNDVFLSSECQNGLAIDGNPCQPDLSVDGIGVVSLTLVTNSGVNTPTPDGKLFSVSFNVERAGFTPLHIVTAVLETLPNGTPLPVTTFDGYFTNIDCGGLLCLPPKLSLTAPRTAIVGNPVTFDGSASKSQNVNGAITQYFWVWRNGLNRAFLTTTSPTATYTFRTTGLWTVTLTVQDNYGASAIETLPINVINYEANVSTSIFFTDTAFNYLPNENFQSVLQPTIEATIAHGVVRNTEPRFVLLWVNVTNQGPIEFQSINVILQMRPEWVVSPHWLPSTSAIHVYFANTSSLEANPEITQASTISVFHSSLLTSVQLVFPNLNTTGIGHPLMPGQSILLSVRLTYDLIGTTQSASTYPRPYDFGSDCLAFSQSGLSGLSASSSIHSELVIVATSPRNDESHSFVIV